MLDLNGKKILLIAPRFFGYEKDIEDQLAHMGAIVDYVDERPHNNVFTKAAIRIDKNAVKKRIFRYYEEVFSNVKDKVYDYVLIINLEAIYPEIIARFRQHFTAARFVLYMWDSFRNKKYSHKCLDWFDKVYSFDREDVSINEKIHFRPLFYVNQFSDKQNVHDDLYDISFIGTIHSDRYPFISSIKKTAEEKKLNTHFYMYFQSALLLYYRKVLHKTYRKAKLKEFFFKPLSKKEVADVILTSRSVIDINHPKQIGLTMRTFEVLGAGKKLITTNEHIKEYDFYNEDNIHVINRDNPAIDVDFIKKPFIRPSKEIMHKYSLQGWVEELFSF